LIKKGRELKERSFALGKDEVIHHAQIFLKINKKGKVKGGGRGGSRAIEAMSTGCNQNVPFMGDEEGWERILKKGVEGKRKKRRKLSVA